MRVHGSRPRWLLWSTVWATVLAVSLGLAAPTTAAEPLPTTLVLTAPSGYADTSVTLRLALTDQTGAPVAAAPVVLERRVEGAWVPMAPVTTNANGRADIRAKVSRTPGQNVFRARYAGDPTYAASTATVQVALKRRDSAVVVSGATSVIDEKSVAVTVRWRTTNGQAVAGRVRLDVALGKGTWRRYRTLTTNAQGRAEVRVTPRSDSRWRAVAGSLAWVKWDKSEVHKVDNRPPGTPIRMPRGAPSPRVKLPEQGHAVGGGANLQVSTIPGSVWRQMSGVSWRSGCPVGRAGLRWIRVNYWDYQGYRRRGALVAATSAARPMGEALAECTDTASRSGRCIAWTASAGPTGRTAPTTTPPWRPATPRPSTAAT